MMVQAATVGFSWRVRLAALADRAGIGDTSRMFWLSILLAVIGLIVLFVARGKVADEDTKQVGNIMVAVGLVLLVIAAIGAWIS